MKVGFSEGWMRECCMKVMSGEGRVKVRSG